MKANSIIVSLALAALVAAAIAAGSDTSTKPGAAAPAGSATSTASAAGDAEPRTAVSERTTIVTPSFFESKPLGLLDSFDVELTIAPDSAGKTHQYRVDVAKRGVREFEVEFLPAEPTQKGRLQLILCSLENNRTFRYEAYPGRKYFFYPMMDQGAYSLAVSCDALVAKDRYTIAMRGDPCLVPDALKAQARKAIEKGTEFLLKGKPRQEYGHWHGVEALVLAALSGEGQKDRAGAVKDYVGWLKASMEDTEGTWGDKKVQRFGNESLYEQSLVCLGLAEAAGGGNAEAKEILPATVRFLLASQLTDQRCQQWTRIGKDNPHYGGWRYTPTDEDADISVTGWCMVALLAGEASGSKEPGIRQAVDLATEYVGRCGGDSGFSYTSTSHDGGNIRDGVGSLLMTLMGEESAELQVALKNMDYHLPSGTQVDDGPSHPLYYSYYGTRLNYLRGGREWEVWRSVAMRQVMRWQKADGSFSGFGDEESISDRYTTALSVMILRICLGDAPAYLKHEARGF